MSVKKSQLSPLMESDDLKGIIVNDSSGLCLASEGDGTGLNSSDSGVFTNLIRLASQLQHGGNGSDTPALVTIETDDSVILCKEYLSHCVAVAVPIGGTNKQASSDDRTDGS